MREFELLTIETIHRNVAPMVDSILQPRNFKSLKPLQWIRSEDAPIRQIFAYRQLKGGALAPAWGFSLDFVPHIAARKVKWHKTEKSAIFDAFVDGQIHRELDVTYMYGVSRLLDGLQSRVTNAIKMATAFWDKGRTLQEIIAIVEYLKSNPRSITHAQLPMAHAFCLALGKRESEGRRELAALIEREGRYPTTELSPKTIAELWHIFDDVLANHIKGI